MVLIVQKCNPSSLEEPFETKKMESKVLTFPDICTEQVFGVYGGVYFLGSNRSGMLLKVPQYSPTTKSTKLHRQRQHCNSV